MDMFAVGLIDDNKNITWGPTLDYVLIVHSNRPRIELDLFFHGTANHICSSTIYIYTYL